jgi:hypothetical protein
MKMARLRSPIRCSGLLRQHGGVYPLWRIFVETPASKIMVFRALKRLRESGKIEMSRSMVVLRGG